MSAHKTSPLQERKKDEKNEPTEKPYLFPSDVLYTRCHDAESKGSKLAHWTNDTLEPLFCKMYNRVVSLASML